MKKELIDAVNRLKESFNDELDSRSYVNLKADVNLMKSKLYMHMDYFDSKAECFMYINILNSLIAKIDFESNYQFKLLQKIRQKTILLLGENWGDFLKECKNELS